MVKTVKSKKDTGVVTMQTANTAKVVDGKLVLSFPLAKNPVVWQMDLNKAQSCALEVKEDKKKKEFALCMKSDSNDPEDIAVFEAKEQALEALMMTSSALQNAAAASVPAGNVAAFPAQHMMDPAFVKANTKSENRKAAILAVILVAVLIVIWSVSVPRNSGPLLSSNQLNETSGSSAAANTAGVPLSADEFLTNR